MPHLSQPKISLLECLFKPEGRALAAGGGPVVSILKISIIPNVCEYCYGKQNILNCIRKPLHDFLNKVKKCLKAKKVTEKEAKSAKKVDLDIRVIGIFTRNNEPSVGPEYQRFYRVFHYKHYIFLTIG